MKHDIIRMAREAGVFETRYNPVAYSATPEALERFAALVAAAEREACADICGRFAMNAAMNELDGYDAYRDCEEAILARGQQ